MNYPSHHILAVQLLSMDITQPLLSTFLQSDEKSDGLRKILRTNTFKQLSLEKLAQFIFFIELEQIKLTDFITSWFWHENRANIPLVNEMTSMFYPFGMMRSLSVDFIEKSLDVKDLGYELTKFRNAELDQKVCVAIRECENAAFSPELSDWDADLINTQNIYTDPKFDLTLPLYKGYYEYTTVMTIRKFLREHFKTQSELTRWLELFEKKFGTLPQKSGWIL